MSRLHPTGKIGRIPVAMIVADDEIGTTQIPKQIHEQ